MSKEHLWPVWMEKYLPRTDEQKHTREAHHAQWITPLRFKKMERQGHLSTIKLRVVCKECNNGWMSNLEAEAKPLLVKFLKDDVFTLNESDQQVLSRWITMKSITGEHAEKDIHVTPTADRLRLRSRERIPDYFAIYLGRQLTDSNTAWLRISQTLALSKHGPSPPLDGLKRNFQSVAFLCGPLFLYVLAARVDNFDVVNAFSFECLVRLWPIENSIVSWPPEHALTPKEMGRIAYVLDDIKSLPNVQYGGNLPED